MSLIQKDIRAALHKTFIIYSVDDETFDFYEIDEVVELQVWKDMELRGYKPTSVTVYGCRFKFIEWSSLVGGDNVRDKVRANNQVREIAWERLADIIGVINADSMGDLYQWMPDGYVFEPGALSPFVGAVGKSWPIRVDIKWNEKGDDYKLRVYSNETVFL